MDFKCGRASEIFYYFLPHVYLCRINFMLMPQKKKKEEDDFVVTILFVVACIKLSLRVNPIIHPGLGSMELVLY